MGAGRDSLAGRLRELLAARGAAEVREVAMFGGRSFMVEGEMACAAREGELLARVDPGRSEELLALPGARPALMGAGRAMGPSWIAVDGAAIADDAALRRWLDLALEAGAARRGGR